MKAEVASAVSSATPPSDNKRRKDMLKLVLGNGVIGHYMWSYYFSLDKVWP